jgi:hypothetical protein
MSLQEGFLRNLRGRRIARRQVALRYWAVGSCDGFMAFADKEVAQVFDGGHPRIAVAAVMGVTALAAPAASAQSPVVQGYGEDHGVVQQVQHASAKPPPAAAVRQAAASNSTGSGASLPFTGLDIAIVVALGGVLAGTGLVLRRASGGRDAA